MKHVIERGILASLVGAALVFNGAGPVAQASPPSQASAPTAVKAPAKKIGPKAAKRIAKRMVARRGWSNHQYRCLVKLWQRESEWRTTAGSPGRSYGIPQAYPGYRMASAGSDWRTNATTQIRWGLRYIKHRYGTPCSAWGHWQRHHWY